VLKIAKKHGLWLVEDCCDALGATYSLPGAAPRHVGGFGDLATLSFYPRTRSRWAKAVQS